MQTRLAVLFEDYSAAHQTRGNLVCHGIGIPLIAVSLLGMLPEPAAIGLMALTGLWYLWMDWRWGMPFALVLGSAFLLGRTIAMPALVSMFVLGWVLQGIGHALYEKKSPSFTSNLRHVLVGPIWLFAKLF